MGVAVLRATYYSEELETDVLRVVGYGAHCPCGWRGGVRQRYAVARSDLLAHKVTAHGHKPL